jgi:hypothetical protein
LAINEPNVENKICKMEKGEMRERTSKYNLRPHLLEYTKREGQVRSQDGESKLASDGNSLSVERGG